MIYWLNNKLGNGIFKGFFAPFVARCVFYLSFNSWLKRLVRKGLKIEDHYKIPAWVSELYLCISFAVGVVFLVIVPFVPTWLACLIACVALYRPFEIMIFAIDWIFTAKSPLHSYKRSLAGFIVNIAEIVVFFAVTYIGFGFMKGTPSISTALYSSMRTAVTIGPTAMLEPPDCWFAGAVIIYQVALSYFLTIVVVAAVVGSLKKKDVMTKYQSGKGERLTPPPHTT